MATHLHDWTSALDYGTGIPGTYRTVNLLLSGSEGLYANLAYDWIEGTPSVTPIVCKCDSKKWIFGLPTGNTPTAWAHLFAIIRA